MITPRTGWDRVGKSQIEASGPKNTGGARSGEGRFVRYTAIFRKLNKKFHSLVLDITLP